MTSNNSNILKQWALAGCALYVIAMAAPAIAQGSETFELDIESKELGQALMDYSIATGQQVLFNDTDVRGKTANDIQGVYTPAEAVEILLRNADVEYRIDGNGTLLVGREYVRQSSLSDQAEVRPFRVVQANQEVDNRGLERRNEEDEERMEEIIVTGTNIRGIAPESSPALVFNRNDILASGAATAQEFIQLLPQNFAGGSNAATSGGLPNDANAGLNSAGTGPIGSSVNLRGLGSGSTLVLLNGRRIAPSSGIGDFVDVSMIPASAIERVDVLTDGVSSIYGADAVAGVVNFVLREDYEGFEFSTRWGGASKSDLVS